MLQAHGQVMWGKGYFDYTVFAGRDSRDIAHLYRFYIGNIKIEWLNRIAAANGNA